MHSIIIAICYTNTEPWIVSQLWSQPWPDTVFCYNSASYFTLFYDFSCPITTDSIVYFEQITSMRFIYTDLTIIFVSIVENSVIFI